jgi:hypothetical protein
VSACSPSELHVISAEPATQYYISICMSVKRRGDIEWFLPLSIICFDGCVSKFLFDVGVKRKKSH